MAKLYTLDEVVTILKVSREEIMKAIPHCAPDFSQRHPHHLTKDEVDCIGENLKKN